MGGSDGSKQDFSVFLVLSYNCEITLKLSRALLVDRKADCKKLVRGLEEQFFYKLPLMDKCTLSEVHKQDFGTNKDSLVVTNLVSDHSEWVVPNLLLRTKIIEVPLSSLFFAVINYRTLMEKYFYLPDSKENAKNSCRFSTLELLNFEFLHQSMLGHE